MRIAFALATLMLITPSFAAEAATRPAVLANESHQIANVGREDLLRPRDASSADRTPIVLYPRQDWRCLTWKFEPAGDDFVRLVNYFTHKTLAPEGDGQTRKITQCPVSKDAVGGQQWRFIPLGDNVYRIEHVATGKALSATANGDVVVEKWTGSDSQKWKLLEKPAKFSG
jgi:hypothetical protein